MEDPDEKNLDEVEGNFVKRMKKGFGKYQGKLPFKCFSCGGIGHYASRCPKRVERNKHREGKENKGKMIKRAYYVNEDVGISDDESNYGDFDHNECLLLDLKDESTLERCQKECTPKKIEDTVVSFLHAKQEKNYWVVDSGCSNRMTSEKSKFVKLKKYDGGFVKFGDDLGARIVG